MQLFLFLLKHQRKMPLPLSSLTDDSRKKKSHDHIKQHNRLVDLCWSHEEPEGTSFGQFSSLNDCHDAVGQSVPCTISFRG